MKKSLFVLCALFGLVQLFALDLVKDGKAVSSIVLPKNPERSVQYAAFELQYHIRLITGADLPIVRENTPASGNKIYLGKTLAAQKAIPAVKDLKREEYIVDVRKDCAFLAGVDQKEYGRVDYNSISSLPRISYHDHSTLWAVYDFLRIGCGVDWYAPGENGITFRKTKNLKVKSWKGKRHPFMKAFRLVYSPRMFKAYGNPYSKREVTELKLRWKQTVRYGVTNHNVYGLFLRYYAPARKPDLRKMFEESRPEYFARNYKGKSRSHLIALRQQYPNDDNLPPQLCNTNKDVIRLLAQEALDRSQNKTVKGIAMANAVHKMKDEPFYYPIQPDDNNGFCRCKECLALFADRYKNGVRPNNYIHFDWMGKIAAEVGKIDPDVGISTLAYNSTLPYPKGLKLPKNLSVMLVLNHSNLWHDLSAKRVDTALKDWTENEKDKRLLTVWLHLLAPAWDALRIFKYKDFFPGYYYQAFAQRLKAFAKGNIQGFFMESPDEIGAPFWNQHLELYLACRMADDPTLDTDKLRRDFFVNYYGESAKPMKAFYDLVEKAYMNKNNYPGNKKSMFNTLGGFQSDAVNWGKCGTREVMDQLARYLAQADSLARTPEVKERLRLFRTGLFDSMKRGRAVWEEKEILTKLPRQKAFFKQMKDAKGDLKKVDWSKAAVIRNWKTLHGKPFAMNGIARCAVDSEYLYIRYEDEGTALKKDAKSLWDGDHLEIFLSSQRARPVYQICIGANSAVMKLGHFFKNDAVFSGKWDYGRSVTVKADKKFFVETAIPLSAFRTQNNKTIHINFFRGFPNGKKCCWNPIFTLAHNTPDRMGTLLPAGK